jgi:hypothetical protein
MPSKPTPRDSFDFTFEGQHYNWDLSMLRNPKAVANIREMLPRLMRAARADPDHPFNKGDAAAAADMQAAYRWLNNEMTEEEVSEVTTRLTNGVAQNAAPDGVTAARDLAELMKVPGVTTALQKRQVDGDRRLTAEEKQLLARHDDLQRANNEQARRERPAAFTVGENQLRGQDKFMPAEVWAISKMPPREQANASRELRAQWRSDPKSPYSDPAHPRHQSYVEAMQALYGSETMADTGESVLNDET